MLDDLPITFSAQHQLFNNDKAATHLLRELEAWLNFETLKASWFEDEEKIIHLSLYLLNEEKLAEHKSALSGSNKLIETQQYFVIFGNKTSNNFNVSFCMEKDACDLEKIRTKLIEILNVIADYAGLDNIE